QVADEAAAAGEAALLVTPDRDRERMTVAVAALAERLRHLDRRHGAGAPVIVPPLGDRVDVGAEQNGRRTRLRAGARPEDVAGGVDPGVESGLAHEPHREAAAVDVGLIEGDAAHAAL